MLTGHRLFGGKRYDFYRYAESKRNANKIAKEYRDSGKGNARVTKSQGRHPFLVWVK